MIYFKGNLNPIGENNNFHTVENFDRNKIVVFTEKTRDYINTNEETKTKYLEIVNLLNEAKDVFRDKNNYPKVPSIHYYKFKPVINFLKSNILNKEGLDQTLAFLMDIKEDVYKKHCNENNFWIDIKNKEEFSKLPHVIGIEIEDKFLVLDGHHRCTLYCIDNTLSLNFDCLYDK